MLLHYLGLLFMVDKTRSPVRSRPSMVAQMVKKKNLSAMQETWV